MPSPARLAAALLIALAPPAAAQSDLPDALVADISESADGCRSSGGTPALTPEFITRADLNGDGTGDFVLDYAAFECANAWSYFCGSAGCPVVVWLSTPTGHRVAWGSHAQAKAVDAATGRVTVALHGAFCSPPRVGVEGCEQALDFAGVFPPPPPEGLSAAAVPNPPAEWTLSPLPGVPLAAYIAAPAPLHALVAFCKDGEPLLAYLTTPQIEAPGLTVGFDFSRQSFRQRAVQRADTGAAHVTLLSGPVLAGLTGPDASVAVSVDDVPAGRLSLKGSTRAIRAIIGGCS